MEEYCSALVYITTTLSVWFLINLIRCTVLLNLSTKDSCADGFIALVWHDASSHDFLWWNFRGRSCDGGQSKISFLCVLNLGGQSIVFSLLFWSLSSTTWTMLFLLPLSHFVWDCSSNYLALMLCLIIPWLGMGECSVVLSLSSSRQNKQLGMKA